MKAITIFKTGIILFIFMFFCVCMFACLTTQQSETSAYNIDKSNINSLLLEKAQEEIIAKELLDFDGNKYGLVEYDPIGYAIYSKYNNEIIESSDTAPSPYLENTQNLYYLGPQQYYIKNNNTLTHTITGQTINFNEVESIVESQSRTLFNAVNSSELITNNKLKNTNNGISPMAIDYSNKYIGYYQFFENMRTGQQIGYYVVGNGVCGYVAANMLLGFYDTVADDSFVPDNSIMEGTGTDRHFVNNDLTRELVDIATLYFGYGYDSTSTNLRHVMNRYFEAHNINASSYDMIVPFFSQATLRNHVDNWVPTILFGMLEDASDSIMIDLVAHAVVVYGYRRTSLTKYQMIVHYGWPGYSHVYLNSRLNGIYGSFYKITT